MKILVEKEHKLKQILGKVKYEEDLMESKNKKVITFLNNYKIYFETIDKNEFKKFYDETGLNITHMYICEEDEVYQNMYGCWIRSSNKTMFNHDLLIIEEVDKIIINNDKVIVDDKELELEDINFEYGNSIRSYISNEETLEDKINYIKYTFDISYVNDKKIKEVMFDSLNNLLILLDTGELYSNNKLIDNDVEYIFEECSSHYLTIYKSNKIESYVSKYINMCSYDNDKVLYGDNYLVTLHNSIVSVKILSDFEFNTIINSAFENIDDIDVKEENIILIKGKEKIKVPIYSYYVMEN